MVVVASYEFNFFEICCEGTEDARHLTAIMRIPRRLPVAGCGVVASRMSTCRCNVQTSPLRIAWMRYG
jgi:hypothetical protein